MTITIRPAHSHQELHTCVDLQITVWGLDPRDAVPFHQLYTAHHGGGQVLVAVDGERIAGFCYGFAGRQGGRPALLSHMLAVLPQYRGQGLGAELKLSQGRWALQNGYDLITWTFDPLEAVNAHLNIARLGGIVRRYLVNHYGEMADGLNKGLPSDRLLLEWHLRAPRVAAILAGQSAPQPAATRTCAVPATFQRIKQTDPALALRWRLSLREELAGALGAGFQVTSFAFEGERAAYGLTRREEAATDAD